MYVSTFCFCSAKNTVTKILAKDVLSPTNKENCIKLLRSMKPINTKTDKSNKNAAVLVPLCSVNDELALLYTVRSHNLKTNRGQVSFPGGMSDSKDQNLKQTALRETFEEIGIPGSSVDIWSKGPEIRRVDLVVTPFLGYIGELKENVLDTNSDEVSSTFALTLDHLCSSKNFRTTQFRPDKSPSYTLPVFLGGQEKIWGLTALITHIFLSALVPNHYRHKHRFWKDFKHFANFSVAGFHRMLSIPTLLEDFMLQGMFQNAERMLFEEIATVLAGNGKHRKTIYDNKKEYV